MATKKETYALVDITPWAMPTDPGPIATYDTTDGKAAMKMKEAIFKRKKKMFTSSDNISRAITQMLKNGMEEKYQMSNTDGVKGWHYAMTVGEILSQLKANTLSPTHQQSKPTRQSGTRHTAPPTLLRPISTRWNSAKRSPCLPTIPSRKSRS
jgi:hypothetical protein